MASTGSIVKGCAIGCGIAVLIVVVTVVGCGITMVAPFKSAEKARENLEEVHGAQGDYRPALDGSVTADRIEAFIGIRESLMEHCEGFQKAFEQFERMDDLDDDTTPKGTMFKEVLGTVGQAFGIAGKMGKFATARNEALLDSGMGLGEYTYIYVVAYYSWLGKDSDPGAMEFDDDRAPSRVRDALRDMLRSQLEDLRAVEPDSPFVEVLRSEIEALNDDRDRLPWSDGLPEAVEASLVPFRGRLEAAFCEGTSPFELLVHRTENKGFTIRAD